MMACISRTFMWHDLWYADHRPVSSVNLTGSPARTGRISAKSYFRLLGWRGVDLAGLLGMTTMPSLTDPLWNLNPVGPVPGPLVPCCYGPLLDWNEDGAVLARPAKPWTSACREVCANLWPWSSDWSSNADELTGPLDASSVGRHLWNVECWTASQWTGSLDLSEIELLEVDDLAKTGAPWRLSGRAVKPVPEYLPWSASCLSRRVASYLAA